MNDIKYKEYRNIIEDPEKMLYHCVDRNILMFEFRDPPKIINQCLIQKVTWITRLENELRDMGPIIRPKVLYVKNRFALEEFEYPIEHVIPTLEVILYDTIEEDYIAYGGSFPDPIDGVDYNTLYMIEFDVLKYPTEEFLMKDYMIGCCATYEKT